MMSLNEEATHRCSEPHERCDDRGHVQSTGRGIVVFLARVSPLSEGCADHDGGVARRRSRLVAHPHAPRRVGIRRQPANIFRTEVSRGGSTRSGSREGANLFSIVELQFERPTSVDVSDPRERYVCGREDVSDDHGCAVHRHVGVPIGGNRHDACEDREPKRWGGSARTFGGDVCGRGRDGEQQNHRRRHASGSTAERFERGHAFMIARREVSR